MPEKIYQVGGELDAKCGRCKEVRGHLIIALVEGLPKRVECLACHSVHNFHTIDRVRTRTTRGSAAARMAVEKRRRESVALSSESAVAYSPKASYEPGMVIHHPKFGLGIVDRVESKKLTVVFGKKLHYLVLAP